MKDYIVKAIITMNPQTFYPTATQTVVAIIQKNIGNGQGSKKMKLINFTDDGYSVVPKKVQFLMVPKKVKGSSL